MAWPLPLLSPRDTTGSWASFSSPSDREKGERTSSCFSGNSGRHGCPYQGPPRREASCPGLRNLSSGDISPFIALREEPTSRKWRYRRIFGRCARTESSSRWRSASAATYSGSCFPGIPRTSLCPSFTGPSRPSKTERKPAPSNFVFSTGGVPFSGYHLGWTTAVRAASRQATAF